MTDQPVPRTYSDSEEHLAMIADNLAARAVGHGLAPPSSGQHAKAEIVYNEEPTVGGPVGWVCTVAGKPGTWESFGSVKELPLTTPVTTIRIRSLFDLYTFDITGTEGISDGIQGQGDVTVAMDAMPWPWAGGSASNANVTVNAKGQISALESGTQINVGGARQSLSSSTTAGQKQRGSLVIGADGSDDQVTFNWGWTDPLIIPGVDAGGANSTTNGEHLVTQAIFDRPLLRVASRVAQEYYCYSLKRLNSGLPWDNFDHPYCLLGNPVPRHCPGGVFPKTWDGACPDSDTEPWYRDLEMPEGNYRPWSTDYPFWSTNAPDWTPTNDPPNMPKLLLNEKESPFNYTQSYAGTSPKIYGAFNQNYGTLTNDDYCWQGVDARNAFSFGFHHNMYRRNFRWGTKTERELWPGYADADSWINYQYSLDTHINASTGGTCSYSVDYDRINIMGKAHTSGSGGGAGTEMADIMVPSMPYLVIGGTAVY